MKAVVIEEFGGPGVLHVVDRELPEPGAGQVRVRVRASGVNPVDGKIRSGAAQQMFPTQLPAVLGRTPVRVGRHGAGEEVPPLRVHGPVPGRGRRGLGLRPVRAAGRVVRAVLGLGLPAGLRLVHHLRAI